jgi:hypothetical protein
MAIKNLVGRVNSGGASLKRFNGLSGNSALRVNNRSVVTSASKGFSSGSAVNQRLEMRRLQSKINTGLYDNNEMAKRRLQDKVAGHASEVYGMDKGKLNKSWRGTGAGDFSSNVRQVDSGTGASLLENKVNTPHKSVK